MAKVDFRTQDGLIVGDGNLLVLNASNTDGATNAVVFAKEFSTHGSTSLTSEGLELRGNDITATGSNTDINIDLVPKGTGEVNISKVDIDGGTIDGVAITGTSATFTSLNLSEGNITNAGDIDADSISVDAAGTGLNIDFSAANTTKSKITLADNLADALNITEGSNSYMKFTTTDGSDEADSGLITFSKDTTFASTNIHNLGTVSAATSITSTAFVGPIDGIVGGNTPAAGSFTTLSASSTSTLVGTVTIGDSSNHGVIATPAGKYLSLLPGDATGSDANGARVVIQGGAGTGQGAGGYVKFELAPPASSTGSSSNAHVEALTLQALTAGANPTATFTGVTTAPTFTTSNTTAGITINGSTISTDGSQGNIHLTLDPAGTGEIDAQAALDMNDKSIKHVDTLYVLNVDANQVGSGTTDKINIGRTDNVTIGGTALADNNIALQVNGGANAALHSNTGGGSGGADADYTEVRLHIGVDEGGMTDLTHPKDLVALVLQNSSVQAGGDLHNSTGSKGIIFDNQASNPGTSTDASTWGIGTTQDDTKRFVIGFSGSKTGYDQSTKGTTNSPLNDQRAGDAQPLYVMDEGGNHYIQLGTHIGGSALSGTLNIIEGNSSATAPKTKIQITGEGAIRFFETGDGENAYIAIQAPANLDGGTTNYTLTLPVNDGSANEVLTTDGSGVLSWAAASGGGIALTDLSVGSEGTASGDGSLGYNSGTGVFTYTPPLNITGNAATVTVADESSDTTCFPLFATAASGSLAPKTGTNLAFNSATGQLTQTGASSSDIGLVLKNTAAPGAGSNVNGQTLRFVTERDGSEAGKNNDDLGFIQWYGNDGAGNNQAFGYMKVRAVDVTSGSESGSMQFGVATTTSGAIENILTITGGVAAASSTVTIAGDLTVNGTTTTISTTQLTVEDDLITISKGNDSLANAEGSGIEIECTGATNPSFTYQDTPAGWEANVNLNLASGKSYKINDVSILSATTIASSVTSASGLATVGTIGTGVWQGTAIADTYVANDLTISGGAIDNSVIGGSTAAAGTFTNLTASNLSVDSVAVLDTSTNTGQTFVNGTGLTIASFAFATYRTVKFVGHVVNDAAGGDTDAFEVLVSYKGASGPRVDSTSNFDADTMMTTYAYMSSGTALGGLSIVRTDPGGTGTDTHIALQFTNSTGGNFTGSFAVTATQLIKT